MGLLGSCSLSFSHLVLVSPDDDLPDRGLLLGFGSFAPLLKPVAALFTGQLDPSEAARFDFLQVLLGPKQDVLMLVVCGPAKSEDQLIARPLSLVRAFV